jgi:hypothetical protein
MKSSEIFEKAEPLLWLRVWNGLIKDGYEKPCGV